MGGARGGKSGTSIQFLLGQLGSGARGCGVQMQTWSVVPHRLATFSSFIKAKQEVLETLAGDY